MQDRWPVDKSGRKRLNDRVYAVSYSGLLLDLFIKIYYEYQGKDTQILECFIMNTIVFLPGILGSELFLPTEDGGKEQIWPPTAFEAKIWGYPDPERLLREDIFPGSPISGVFIVDFYGSLDEDLQEIARRTRSNYIAFGYDWRLDITKTAALLADRLDGIKLGKNDSITLVGHSMGGLVCRYLLESGSFDKRKWFAKINAFLGLAVPNLGSAVAIGRALGLEGTVGLSADAVRSLSADSRYPSLYQLLPPPNHTALWHRIGSAFSAMDLFNDKHREELGLDLCAKNLAVSKATWGTLATITKPDHVRYVFLAGTGHDTVARIEASRRPPPRMISSDDAGDGTVVLWSAIPPAYPHAVSYGSHESFFQRGPARDMLFGVFGLYRSGRMFAAEALTKPPIDLSIESQLFGPEQPMDVVLIPSAPSNHIKGVAYFEQRVEDAADGRVRFIPMGSGSEISYSGPSVRVASLRLLAPSEAGIYRIRFDGSHQVTSPDQAAFIVRDRDIGRSR